mgnify:CR=1 FL=1
MMRRFVCYLDKVMRLSQRLSELCDSRQRPQIPSAAVFLCIVLLQATRLGSLHAMAQQLRANARWRRVLGSEPISEDSMGRIVDTMDSEALRQMLRQSNLLLRRNKLLEDNPWPLRFVALDGHEFFSLTPSQLPHVLPAPAERGRAPGGGVLSPGRGGPPDRL